jgi:hypothetical protein
MVGELESWRVGELESWRVGELESWRVGELESWRVGELESSNSKIFKNFGLGRFLFLTSDAHELKFFHVRRGVNF